MVGGFNPRFSNLPDFDLWVRMVLEHELHIMDNKFVRFRKFTDEVNASGDNLTTHIRIRFEYEQILDHYLEISDPEELLLIFPEATKYGKPTAENIPYFLGRIAVESGLELKILLGLETIYSLLQNDDLANNLLRDCIFSYLDFIKLTGSHNVFKLIASPQNQSSRMLRRKLGSSHNKFYPALKKYYRESLPALRIFLAATKKFLKNVLTSNKKKQ